MSRSLDGGDREGNHALTDLVLGGHRYAIRKRLVKQIQDRY